jgi:hypothetical protein
VAGVKKEVTIRPIVASFVPAAAGTALAVAGVLTVLKTPADLGPAHDYFAIAAIVLIAGVISWAVIARPSFGRLEQFVMFVTLAAIAGGWYASYQWSDAMRAAFVASRQGHQLKLNAARLADTLVVFLSDRERVAPPRPAGKPTKKELETSRTFEAETLRLFENNFAREVRATHDLLAIRGLHDHDLDVMYRHPENGFQIRIIASRFAMLASGLD